MLRSWSGADETFIVIINVENNCALYKKKSWCSNNIFFIWNAKFFSVKSLLINVMHLCQTKLNFIECFIFIVSVEVCAGLVGSVTSVCLLLCAFFEFNLIFSSGSNITAVIGVLVYVCVCVCVCVETVSGQMFTSWQTDKDEIPRVETEHSQMCMTDTQKKGGWIPVKTWLFQKFRSK